MRKKLLFSTGLAVCLSLLIVACSKSSEDLLQGNTTTPVVTCDTILMKYSTDIVNILKANCYSCHGAGSTGGSGGIDLSTYANLLKWASNGYLVGTVSHATGYVGMPYGSPKMDACTVNKIVAWVHQGFKNN